MRGQFDEEFEPPRRGRDTELTLGSTTLLAIFFGMVLLCGLFFGLGFAVGRYGPSDSVSAPQPSGSAPAASTAGSKPKPSAVSSALQPPRETVAAEAPAGSPAASDAPKPVASAMPPRPAAEPQARPQPRLAAQPQVRPALPVQSSSAPPSAPAAHPAPSVRASAPPSQPAVRPSYPASSSGIMVQIAAVSHQEDADVLVNALRRRGYPVSVRRQPVDNLLHVQIGPFATRNDANAIRQKLLSDGYNAIVQP